MFRTGQSYPSDYTSHDSRPENGRRSVIRMEQSNPSDNTSHDSRPENGRREEVCLGRDSPIPVTTLAMTDGQRMGGGGACFIDNSQHAVLI